MNDTDFLYHLTNDNARLHILIRRIPWQFRRFPPAMRIRTILPRSDTGFYRKFLAQIEISDSENYESFSVGPPCRARLDLVFF